jgi:uncharacterized protein YcbK (DUF882 family)
MVEVELYNLHRREAGAFLLPLDGKLDADAAKEFGRFFRDKRTGRHGPMGQGTVAILADLAKTFPGKTIHVVSGWRAPPNGAPHSKHFRGRAVDLRIPGVKIGQVRDHLWLKHRHVGVGFYPSQRFIHVDSRPEETDMAWTSRREGAPNRYHPAWAERLLPDLLSKEQKAKAKAAKLAARRARRAELSEAAAATAQPPSEFDLGMQRLLPNSGSRQAKPSGQAASESQSTVQ